MVKICVTVICFTKLLVLCMYRKHVCSNKLVNVFMLLLIYFKARG